MNKEEELKITDDGTSDRSIQFDGVFYKGEPMIDTADITVQHESLRISDKEFLENMAVLGDKIGDKINEIEIETTHWMPLPEPPKI